MKRNVDMLESKIEWTNFTWNPWSGCKKVSPGCKYCYMYRDKDRFGKDPKQVIKSKTKFDFPLKLQKQLNNFEKRSGLSKQKNPKIFTCSWSDFFIDESDEWRKDAWDIIRETPEFDYQILTKRPERIKYCLPDFWDEIKNVLIGVSVESQEQCYRIHMIDDLQCKTFVSFEPLLGRITLLSRDYSTGETILNVPGLDKIDWAIIGGESGNKSGKWLYRHCQLEWIAGLIKELDYIGVPVFIKQLGTYLSDELNLKDIHGRDMDEFPQNLKRREFYA